MSNCGMKTVCASIIIGLVIAVSCTSGKSHIARSSDVKLTPINKAIYDTLEGDFAYEDLIQAYLEVDVIVKNGGFVQIHDSINKNSYFQGYYIINTDYLKMMKEKLSEIHYDYISFEKIHDLTYAQPIKNGTYRMKGKINPFCGAYYKKIHMRMEVLDIGRNIQRLPLFAGCDEYRKITANNTAKHYQELSIPTYVITKVFEIFEK